MFLKIGIICLMLNIINFTKVKTAATQKNKIIWPDGIIPFSVDDNIGCPKSVKCKQIRAAIEAYQRNTCLRFKKYNENEDSSSFPQGIQFTDGFDLFEEYDYTYNSNAKPTLRKISDSNDSGHIFPNKVYVSGEGPQYTLSLIQSIGLAIGLVEEYRRSDRDDFIKVNPNKIHRRFRGEFSKINKSKFISLTDFDLESIMLNEKSYIFGNGKGPILTYSSNGYDVQTNRTLENPLSKLDIKGINELYNDCKEENPRTFVSHDVY